MATTSTDRPSMSGDESRRLPLYVSELRHVFCWICSSEETRTDESIDIARKCRRSTHSRSSFVHPCKCSLVAHEKCLLSWMRQYNIDHPGVPVRCPQCKTLYQLEQPYSLTLNVLEYMKDVVKKIVPMSASIMGLAGVWVAATAHGCLSVRLFLGPRAARRVLQKPWPWHFWIDLPLIPLMLVASRLPVLANFSTWLPTLLALPITQTTPVRTDLLVYQYTPRMLLSRHYPPNPFVLMLFLPWLRVMYLSLKRQLYRHILIGDRRGRSMNRLTQVDNGNTRMIVMRNDGGEGEFVETGGETADTYETLDDGTLLLHQDIRQEQGVELDDLEEQMFETGNIPPTIYVTYYNISKLLVQALGFPLVANLSGSLLSTLSKYSRTLSRALGIAPGVEPISDIAYWTKALASSGEEIGRFDDTNWTASPHDLLFDQLDPIWYRNLLGGGLYIIVKDALVLLYRYLRKWQRQQLRIKDLPFSEGVARELDKV